MSGPSLDFVGIAAPRCGTTWLSTCLAEHPDICMAKPRETFFFSRPYNLNRGLEFYRKHFSHCTSNSITGEFTPDYYVHQNIAKLLLTLNPNLKLIVCLRNPYLRTYSHQLYLERNIGIKTNLTQAIAQNGTLIKNSLYYKHLSQFLSYFNRNNIHIVITDLPNNTPEQTMAALYSFLSVDKTFKPPSLRKHLNRSDGFNYYIPKLEGWYLRRNRWAQKKFAAQFVHAFEQKPLLPIVRAIRALNTRKPLSTQAPTEDFYKKLAPILEPDIRKLERYLNMSLDHWKFDHEEIG